MIIATKKEQPVNETWHGIDVDLRAVPLCIRENRLDGDMLPPDSPNTARATLNAGILASPTSIVDVINCLPHEKRLDNGSKTKKTQKKKKGKSRLFRSRRKSSESEADIAKQEALIKEALRLNQIREEEDADFAKLRSEEEESPKLDMLVHYKLTIMEEVLSMPISNPSEEVNDSSSEEGEPPLNEQVGDPIEGKLLDLGRFEEEVKSLRVSKVELHYFVSRKGKFEQLQEELRGSGVITNETLRQKIHVLCRIPTADDDNSECGDLFSGLLYRGERGLNTNLSSAYRRMNEVSTEIDWKRSIEDDPTMSSANSMKSKKKWSDRKLLNLVTNYSQKGRESYHSEFQDGVEENDMLAYDRDLQSGVDLLTYCVHDLVPIVEEHEVFANLQKELRKMGAVTNEVLKQGLHFYVRDIRLQKEQKEAALRAMEEKEGTGREDASFSPERRDTKQLSLLRKLRFRSNR